MGFAFNLALQIDIDTVAESLTRWSLPVAPKMTPEHKAALAKGRAQSRAVKDYLNLLERDRKRGPKMTADKLEKRLEDTREAIENEADPAKRLELIQKRLDDEERLGDLQDQPDTDAIEQGFVESAKEYGERKGITYTAWRELGVPAAVLKQAGVPRTRRTT